MNKNVIKKAARELRTYRANETAIECMNLRGNDAENTSLKAAVGAVELALGGLHPDDRLLLYEFYVDRTKGYLGRLCRRFECSESSVYRKKRRALELFAMRLFGDIG